jgi:histidinol-phosphatase (PHP family)
MKFLTDMHTHSTYSFDGRSELKDMLVTAQKKGIAFYGVSDHFNYDYILFNFCKEEAEKIKNENPENYFHGVRHEQEDYAGAMNVLVGAEFGYSDDRSVWKKYQAVAEKYSPDFIINSVHGESGKDYARYEFTGDKLTVYKEYLALIRRSLDVSYPYDIVGHIGYVARYVPFENKEFSLSEFGEEIDDILTTIIQKDKILEVNSSNKKLAQRTIPAEDILRRYYELGGRKISFGSDAHDIVRIADKRDEVMEMLKKIGFTHVTVPCRGEHIKVEI